MLMTKLKTKSLTTNIAYKAVKNVVNDHMIYVYTLALGFPFHKSLIVGKNPANVTKPPILYRNVIV